MAIQQLHTYCAMCVSRCGVVATVEDGLLKQVRADPPHPNGCICVKGAAAPEIVYSPDRLRYPMRRTRPKGEPDPGWVRISWDEAMTLAASRLLDIKARYGAEAVVFGIGTPAGSATSDYWDWLQRLANAFGSPNFTDPIYICAWNWGFGSQYTYGVSGHRRTTIMPAAFCSGAITLRPRGRPPPCASARPEAEAPSSSSSTRASTAWPRRRIAGSKSGPAATAPSLWA